MSTPPSPRTLTVSIGGLTRREADLVIEQLAAMGHTRTATAADDGAPLPDVLAVIVRSSHLAGTTRLVHVVGEAGAIAAAEGLAGEPGSPALAAWGACSWEQYKWVLNALHYRQDTAGWHRLGAAPGAANVIESALTSAMGRPAGVVRLPVAERVAIPEVAR